MISLNSAPRQNPLAERSSALIPARTIVLRNFKKQRNENDARAAFAFFAYHEAPTTSMRLSEIAIVPADTLLSAFSRCRSLMLSIHVHILGLGLEPRTRPCEYRIGKGPGIRFIKGTALTSLLFINQYSAVGHLFVLPYLTIEFTLFFRVPLPFIRSQVMTYVSPRHRARYKSYC